jgi:nucleoid-associated protein YgaU
MNRYADINKTTSKKGSQIYKTVRYPDIPRLNSDTYVFSTIGDRYDTLAQEYYGDSSLWWVIANANSKLKKDSLTPPIGSQIRIPANPTNTIADYNEINE